jgi:hypothetical protein
MFRCQSYLSKTVRILAVIPFMFLHIHISLFEVYFTIYRLPKTMCKIFLLCMTCNMYLLQMVIYVVVETCRNNLYI